MPSGVYDRRPQPTRTDVRERREEYARLRDSGLTEWQAALEVGADPKQAGARYERWYQADPADILRPVGKAPAS